MLTFPHIDPVVLHIGPLAVRWYGLMYVLGTLVAWWLARRRAQAGGRGWNARQVDDLIVFSLLGVILGARLGYVLFYDLAFYLESPAQMLKLWQGGMSFHGGLIGVLVAMAWVARRNGHTFWQTVDMVAPLVPPGLFFGRIGNFINAELYGRITESPLGMIFPGAGPLPRHPSQLYEAFFEGIILFIVLWYFSFRKRPGGAVSAVFAIGYGLCRFFVEFFRQPDAHLGPVAFNWLTMGQILCLPLIVSGILVLLYVYRSSNIKQEKKR